MFGSRPTRSGTYRQNRIRGLKAAIKNPRTTSAGRAEAKHDLHTMGVKANKPSLGTRLRHLFHLPGKSHHRNAHASHTTTHPRRAGTYY